LRDYQNNWYKSMLKFLKNPFGKEQEKVQRKAAPSSSSDTKEKDKKSVDVKIANQLKTGKPLAEKKEDKKDNKATKEIKNLNAGFGIILKPHATEKTAKIGSFDTYSFIVARSANKIEIKKAFWRMYGIKPNGIRVVNMISKRVSFKRQGGFKSAWKKVYIRVPKDSNISVYEGV